MVKEMRSKAIRSTPPVVPQDEDNRTIKVVCEGNGHGRRSSIIDRIPLRRRPTSCQEAVRRSWGDEALAELVSEGQTPSCQRHQVTDRKRPAEWCSQCAGSDWGVSLSGFEYLLEDSHVPRKQVVGDRHGVPDAELMSTTRQRYPLECDCGQRAEMKHDVMDRIFSDFANAGKSRVLLSQIVAMLSSNR